jgi:CDP-diacylglycerol--glycerol-3-phosphate 3-phosphatidyltransferase
MGLYSIKPTFVRRLRRIEDALVRRRTSPDALTLAAVGVSIAAGCAIAAGGMLRRPSIWLAVPPLVLIRLALNALDGSVARRTGRARPAGTALNEIGDRVGDAAMIGAAGFVARPELAAGAVASSFLASFTGVLALALTGNRETGGPAGKADRVAWLAAGSAAGAIAGTAVPFTIVLWAIVGGGIATTVVRMRRIGRTLAGRELGSKLRPELLAETVVDVPSESVIEEEMLHAVGR